MDSFALFMWQREFESRSQFRYLTGSIFPQSYSIAMSTCYSKTGQWKDLILIICVTVCWLALTALHEYWNSHIHNYIIHYFASGLSISNLAQQFVYIRSLLY